MSSGDGLLFLTPGNAELSGSVGNGFAGPATMPTVSRTPSPTGPQENAQVIAFPDDDQYFAIFNCVMPNHYSGGGLLIDVLWTCAAIVGSVQFIDWFTRWDEGDPFLTKEPFGGQSLIDAAPSTARDVQRAQMTHDDGAQMGNVVANDFFRFVLYREADPPDTIIGDVEVLAIYFTEQ